MKLKRSWGECITVKFWFEPLSTLCFYCGLIGHSANFCELLYDDLEADAKVLPFVPELRANNK